MRIGPAQGCSSSICIKTKQIVGEGIYCTPKIEIAVSGYTSEKINFQESKYGIIIQCRVKPSAIKYASEDIWIINNPKDIRPYGIIFAKG